MRNNIMNDAKVEKDRQYITKFDFSAGNSNSCNIGRVDVGFSQMLVPGSKMLIKQEQLVRMAPLVAPTYAKQFFKTWGMQVPIEDVWPNFSAMMTQESISRNGALILPSKVPNITANRLLALCLEGAHCSVFRYYNPTMDLSTPEENQSRWESRIYSATASDNDWGEFCDSIVGSYFSAPNNIPGLILHFGRLLGIEYNSNLDVRLNNLGPASLFKPEYETSQLAFYDSDLVLKPDFSIIVQLEETHLHWPHWARFNFRLSSFGRSLFKTFNALGYPTDFGNSSVRSLLPLFACYKAYWDIFGLNQFQNWEETYCSRLITALQNVSNQSLLNIANSGYWGLFKNFVFGELAQMWVTEKDDYISAHLPQPTISTKMTGVYGVADAQPNDGSSIGGRLNENIIVQRDSKDSSSAQPNDPHMGHYAPDGHAYLNVIEHSHLDSEALKRLYKMTNRNTMLGREIAKLMEARGLGMYMQRTRTNMIGETTMSLDISPVFSTSDTYNEATDEGANVGDYAGKGVGYRKDDKPMFVKTDSFCFVIILTAITADSGYSQGEDITTRAVDSDSFFQPAFEDLGQEIHEKSVVVAHSDGVIVKLDNEDNPYIVTDGGQKSFGYATRYSGWKVGRSCSNGSFALASTRDDFIPFIGDKLIFPEERIDVYDKEASEVSANVANGADIYLSYRLLSYDNLPTAGNAWRFLMRYPWMQNLLRIFRNKGKQYVGALLSNPSYIEQFERLYLLPDNYMVFNDVWAKAWCPMLPIAETYGTIDHDKKELQFVDRA